MTEEKLWEFVAAWERKDVPTLMEFIADDCVYITTTGPAPGTVYEGKEQIEAAFTEMLSQPDDGSTTTFGPAFVTDGWGVLEWASTSVDEEGKAVTMRGIDFCEFRGDLISRKDVFRKVLNE